MIYLDSAATSYHKPDGVARAVAEAFPIWAIRDEEPMRLLWMHPCGLRHQRKNGRTVWRGGGQPDRIYR